MAEPMLATASDDGDRLSDVAGVVRSEATALADCATDRRFEKTTMCKFYFRGRCRRGKACHFAHGWHELKPRPDLFKTQMCIEFVSGERCVAGGDCRFAHGPVEVRRARARGLAEPRDTAPEVHSVRAQVKDMQRQLMALHGAFDRAHAFQEPAADDTAQLGGAGYRGSSGDFGEEPLGEYDGLGSVASATVSSSEPAFVVLGAAGERARLRVGSALMEAQLAGPAPALKVCATSSAHDWRRYEWSL